MPAFLEAWSAGIFRRDSLMRNISAGIVVGIVALPLAMAFAIASGAKRLAKAGITNVVDTPATASLSDALRAITVGVKK